MKSGIGSADEGSKLLRRLPTPGWMCSHHTDHVIKNNSRKIAENLFIFPRRDATVIALTMRNGRSRLGSFIYEILMTDEVLMRSDFDTINE